MQFERKIQESLKLAHESRTQVAASSLSELMKGTPFYALKRECLENLTSQNEL
jgi:hypothetical protein